MRFSGGPSLSEVQGLVAGVALSLRVRDFAGALVGDPCFDLSQPSCLPSLTSAARSRPVCFGVVRPAAEGVVPV